jgi:hypothetical protein
MGAGQQKNQMEQAFMVESWGEAPMAADRGIEVPIRLEILQDFS